MVHMGPVSTIGFYFQALGRQDNEALKRWQAKLNVDVQALDTADLMALFALEELVAELDMRRAKASEIAKMHRRLRALGFDFGLREIQRIWESAVRRAGENSGVPEDQALRIRMSLFRFISEDHKISKEALGEVIDRAEGRVRDR
jgi:hypothetical protein